MRYLEDLGIGLKIYQDDKLYRFTSDSVLLAKFATAKNKDIVADFCSGSGVVGFYFYGLNVKSVKNVTFFELQDSMFDMSVESISFNRLEDKFFAVKGKIQDIPNEYAGKFSLIVCNPPYMEVNSGTHDEDVHRAVCRRETALPLSELLPVISKCLKYGGRCAICYRADRLSDLICGLRENGIEPKKLQFVCPRGKTEPYLILLEGIKGGKSGIKILPYVNN